MLDPMEVIQTEAQPAAVIRCTIPREEIGQVMGSAIAETIAAATSQGIGPAGPVFSNHFRLEPEIFDFEVGVPVTGELTPVGRVVASELPARRVVRTVYTGPYEGLGAAWGEFMSLIEDAGHERGQGIFERYLTDPNTVEDASQYRTELNCPIL
ncbi:MAG: GyrI-like domain-containing protein [Roseimicrobium sp.]